MQHWGEHKEPRFQDFRNIDASKKKPFFGFYSQNDPNNPKINNPRSEFSTIRASMAGLCDKLAVAC
jgi:hypothetical protein